MGMNIRNLSLIMRNLQSLPKPKDEDVKPDEEAGKEVVNDNNSEEEMPHNGNVEAPRGILGLYFYKYEFIPVKPNLENKGYIEVVDKVSQVNNDDKPKPPEFSAELAEAINSQDIEKIEKELDKLGISYVSDRDASKNYQNAYIVKFIYEGQEFNIPCEYKSFESNTQPIDNSIESQLSRIVDGLKAGNLSYNLEELNRLGVEYNLQELKNGGYVITFNYEGKDYVAAYIE